MAQLNLVTQDQESLLRKMTAIGVDPRMIDIILEMHDTSRNTEKLVGELMDKMESIIQALALLDTVFKSHTASIRDLKKKYGDDNIHDIVDTEKFDG